MSAHFKKFLNLRIKKNRKMKTKIFATVAIVALALVSCKKDGKSGSDAANTPAVEEVKNFRVELDVTAEKDDDFALYYTEDKTINFKGEQAVWSGIKGMKDNKVTLNLGEEIVPTNVRLDFGIKKGEAQGDVTLSRVKMTYYAKSFEFKGSDFFKYFIENKDTQTKIDQAAGTITFLKNPASQATPFYYPHQLLIDEIAKITK